MATALDDATTAVRDRAAYVSLHTANPGSSGSNEVSGSGYARQPVTWGNVTDGQTSMDGTLAFTGPASGPVTHVGFWTAQTGGTFVWGQALTGDQSFNAAGMYSVIDLTMQTEEA